VQGYEIMKLVPSSLLVALVFPLCGAAPPPAIQSAQPLAQQAAASPEKIGLARQFVNLALPPERYMELMRAGAASGLANSLAGLKDEDAQTEGKADLDRFFARLEPVMKAQLPVLSEAYASAYAREYSAAELQQMIAFAQTPAGQHYLSRRDFVDLDPAVLEVQMKMFESFAPLMKQIQKEQCQAHTAQRIAAGDKNAKCPLADKAETAAG
jgi:hypothetical protein